MELERDSDIMEERIIEILNRKNKALTIDELFRLLELNRSDYEELVTLINKMCAEYTIYQTNKGRYMTFT